MKKIVRDSFTERLLAVRLELVKRDALGKKKDFSEALGITSVFWNHIEAQRSNYPKDKHILAAKGLLQAFSVNMNYLHGTSDKMFIAEPEKRKNAVGEKVASVDFRDKKQKQDLFDDMAKKDERIKELEAKLAAANKEIAKLKKQNNPGH